MDLEKGFYGSPRWTYEILDCAMPMTFDTYSNCAHQCVYCFAFFQRAVRIGADDYLHHRVKAVNVEKVKRMFSRPDEYAGQFASYIKNRFVLQWGGLSDGFDWYEKKFRKSLELLRFFREIDYPVSISTKGTWFLDDPEYREVLKDAKNTHWKYSIITLNEQHAKMMEAGVPPPEERFDALRKLNELGVGATTLRFRPFVIGSSELDADEMMRKAKEVGCYSVTTEFLSIEKRATENHMKRYKIISDVVGFDIWDYYRKNSYSGSGLMRLNYDLKRPYIDAMLESAKRHDILLFISDAHHKEKSATASCCGLPNEGPLSVTNKGQYSEAIMIAKEKGEVRWSDIAGDAAWLKEIPFVKAEGFNTTGTQKRAHNKFHTMYDYMRDCWNKPKSWQSPARYFGGALVPAELDDDGDIVYLYNKPFVEDGIRTKSVLELMDRLKADTESEKRDGGTLGHVAYPVFIPSKGRPNCLTAKLMDDSHINYTLVVEPQDADAYAEAYPHADFLILPENDAGMWYARQFVLEHCRQEGLTWYWLIDDDIKRFTHNNETSTPRAALSYAEGLTNGYSRLAMVGIDFHQFAWSQKREYSVNKRVAVVVLTNTTVDANHRPEVPLKGDLDFQLQCLDAGWSTITVHTYAMDTPAMGSTKTGGLSDFYKDNAHVEAAKYLVDFWQPYTKIVEKPLGDDVKVDWKMFPNTLRAR